MSATRTRSTVLTQARVEAVALESFPCTWCNASPGHPCTTWGRTPDRPAEPRATVHVGRWYAARDALRKGLDVVAGGAP